MPLRLFITLAALAAAPPALAVGFFENPPDPPTTASGIGLVSGWNCNATTIEVEIDGVRHRAAYGTERPDTASVCGGKTGTGFGLLVNWGDFGPGQHTLRALADGVEFGSRTVTVPDLGGVFLTGKSGSTVIDNFPSAGRRLVLEWREGLQSFVVKEVKSAPSIHGTWYGPDLERRSNCSASQNNGSRGTYGQWDATLDTVSGTLRIQQTGLTGLSCTYSGTYRLNGTAIEWIDGTYSCSDGKTGAFHSTDFMVSDHAFSIRLAAKLSGSETCDIDAMIGGNRY